MPAPQEFITRAPRDLAGWVALFDPAALPVLADTATALEDLREVEDAVDAHRLGETLADDPLMTIKLLAHLARLRRGRGGSDTETVTEALVMLGIPPFFRTFGPQTAVEDLLAPQPEALAGLLRVLRRAHRAARFAMAFAVHRMDPDAALIHEAALLHDFAELLLWLRAPALALEVVHRQQVDAELRSTAAQRACLHIELRELQHALATAWRLPATLAGIFAEQGHAETPQRRNVHLAIRVARHSTMGWDNPALPDDVAEIGRLLQLAPEPTLRLLREIDAD